MHEMGIALQIIQIAQESIPADLRGARVERIRLKVGQLAGVVPDSLRFCFEAVSQDTPLAGAQLHIEEVAVVARCQDCGHRWTITAPAFVCEKCHSGALTLLSGRELDIEAIDIIDEEPSDAQSR